VDHIVEPARRIPVIDRPEVLVVGAGASGCAAAIAAARNGADVLLVERFGFLGGSLTAGFGPLLGFHDAAGRQVVRGIAAEIVEDLVALGGSRGHLPDLTGVDTSRVSFDPEAKWSLFDIVEMKEELEVIFGRKVDLVEKEALRNPFRRHEILKTAEVIYAANRR
jgi:flavin-dependent dehydrogenase